MIINDEVQKVIENSAFLSLVTVNADGAPHPIIAGKGEVADNKVVFGIYKMEVTQKNLSSDNRAWVVAATTSDGPKGYRLAGTAEAKGKNVIFTPASIDAMI
jgi:hypothetical protein